MQVHTEVIFFATIATADRGKFLSASSLFQKTTQKFMYFLSHFRTESGNTDTFCVIFLVCNRKIYSGVKMYNYVWKTFKSIYALLLHINNCRKLRAFCLLLQKYDQGILVENMIISNMTHFGDRGGNGAEYEGQFQNYDLARSCVMLGKLSKTF